MAQVRTIKARRRSARIGLSLIEVLVAISILTVGMLSILILFPAGLSTLQVSANSTNADRLGQAELEKAGASQVQLIAAIYANDDSTAGINPVTLIQNSGDYISSVGTLATTPNDSLSNGTDVDAFRSIQGETVRIPAPNAQGNSLYTLVADPIESGSLTVSGTPWQGVSGDSGAGPAYNGVPQSDVNYSDPTSQLTAGQSQYLIDYTNGEIALAAEPTGSTAYDEPISITVTGADGKSYLQLLTVKKLQVGQWVPLSSLVDTSDGTTAGTEPPTPWAAGTDVLVRNFTQVGGTTGYTAPGSFTSDPYQWSYYLPDYASSNPTTYPSANLGVIVFNPATSTMHGPNGRPLEALLSYKTFDWHIISEDRLINSLEGTTHLSLISLLSATAGDKLSDNSTPFTGLFTYSRITNPDFIVLDMDKGNVLVEGQDYTVNYPSGSISFINTTNGTYANDHLRIFYHAAKDWAVALARAPIVYSNAPITTSTPPLSCYSVSGTLVYFPLADIGKQVDIRFQYTASGSTSAITSEGLYTIIASGTNLAAVNLTDATQSPATIPSTATVTTPLLSVKGVSMSAIVIWKDNGIWHNRTLSTVLPTVSSSSATNEQ